MIATMAQRRSIFLLAGLFLFAGAFVFLLYLNRAPRVVPVSAQRGVPGSPLVLLNVQVAGDSLAVVTKAARELRADFIFLHGVGKSDLSAYTSATGSLPAAFHGGSAILSRHPLYEQSPAGDGGVRAVAVVGGKKFAVICSTQQVNQSAPAIIASPDGVDAKGWTQEGIGNDAHAFKLTPR